MKKISKKDIIERYKDAEIIKSLYIEDLYLKIDNFNSENIQTLTHKNIINYLDNNCFSDENCSIHSGSFIGIHLYHLGEYAEIIKFKKVINEKEI